MVRINRKQSIANLGCLLLVAIWGCSAEATTKTTAEATAVRSIQLAIKIFVSQHDGQFPTNWAQLGAYIHIDDLNEQTLIRSSAYPIQEHYVFVHDKILLPDTNSGDVFLIRTSPLTNDFFPDGGRYIISQTRGEALFNYLSEINVQKMLREAGVTALPKPLVEHTNATAARPVAVPNSWSNAPTAIEHASFKGGTHPPVAASWATCRPRIQCISRPRLLGRICR